MPYLFSPFLSRHANFEGEADMQYTKVREPNAVEKRLIARHACRFYNDLLVAGVYQIPDEYEVNQIDQIETYIPALTDCLEAHSFLSVVLRKNDQGKQSFYRPRAIDLREHFRVIRPDGGLQDKAAIAQAIERLCNDPGLGFSDVTETRPPWRIDVMKISSSNQPSRVFISFTYSHYIGDGMSGVAFHRTFAEALSKGLGTMNNKALYKTSPSDLPMLPHLPVSLGYLLAPALGHYLPRFLADWLGLKASASGFDENTWTAGKTFIDHASIEDKNILPVTTAIEISSIDNKTLTAVLQACRRHDTKLTSLLNEIIAQCLSRYLPAYTALTDSKNNFIAVIPTNIRKLVGVPDTTMGILASAVYTRHEISRHIGPETGYTVTEAMWSKSRIDTAAIHKSSTTLQDQPIALLNWISDIDAWMAGQIDRPRDVTWDLSNILAFNAPKSEGGARLEKMYFCQPADATAQPLSFNVISTKGGDLTICAAWQVGALSFEDRSGEGVEQIERKFVQEVLESLENYLRIVAGPS